MLIDKLEALRGVSRFATLSIMNGLKMMNFNAILRYCCTDFLEYKPDLSSL